NEVEAESFRKIFEYIDIAIISKLPWSANTIHSDSIKYFEESKLVIIEHLSTARSNIHLSFDMSTSPNCKALLAITAHWTSSNYKAVATLLAIRNSMRNIPVKIWPRLYTKLPKNMGLLTS